MAGETLTVLSQHVTYTAGSLFINILTQEECYLTLLYSSAKPTRKRNPNIQEPGMKTHRWIFQMTEIHELPDPVPLPLTVHNFEFPFPELNDTIWFSAVYHDLPRAESPQAPIFAWRLPLTPYYTTEWPQFPPDTDWFASENPPDSTVTSTPGRVALAATAGTQPQAGIARFTALQTPPEGPSARGFFVLYDAAYFNRNNADSPFYLESAFIIEPGFSDFANLVTYGDISVDPCTFGGLSLVGFFQPHVPHLFCLDLALSRTTDLCGNPLPTWADPRLYFWEILAGKLSPTATIPAINAAIRPLAMYTMTGPMQDISRHWWYLRPLLPQGSKPRFTQPNYRTGP